MAYKYCAATTSLTDAEIVAIIRHLRCCDSGEVLEGGIDMLRLEAGCDLEEGHAGPHAGYQLCGRSGRGPKHLLGPPVSGWLMWGGAVREIVWPEECPAKADGLSCLLFDGHEGSHLHWSEGWEEPAWLRHECH